MRNHCMEATQEGIHVVLRQVLAAWTRARTHMSTTQRMTLAPKLSAVMKDEAHTTGTSGRIEQLSSKSKLSQGGVAEIFVRTIFDKTITIVIGGMLTTDDLLTRIGEGASLMFAGHHIEAGRSLMDYNIQNRSTLQQTRPLLGGMRNGVDAERGRRSMALRVPAAAHDGSARSQTPPQRKGAAKPTASGSHRSTTPPRRTGARGTPPTDSASGSEMVMRPLLNH